MKAKRKWISRESRRKKNILLRYLDRDVLSDQYCEGVIKTMLTQLLGAFEPSLPNKIIVPNVNDLSFPDTLTELKKDFP